MSTVQNERDVILEGAIQRLDVSPASDISLTGRGVEVAGNVLSKPASSLPAWDADAYSNQNSTASAFASATAATNDGELVFGLNQDPKSGTGYASIDYGWRLHADGTVSIVESGQEISLQGTITGNVGGGTGAGTGGTTTTPPVTLGYYGSSFVAGYNGSDFVATPVPEYVDSRTNNLAVTNYGVNSSNTTKAINGTNGVQPPWAQQMANTSDQWIIIEYGLSDSYDLTVDAWRTNLRQMYNDAVNTGKQVIFQTIHYVDTVAVGDPEASGHIQGMRDEAAVLGIHLIDTWAYTKPLWQPSIRTYVPDGYHPNQGAYNTIGEYVTNQLLTFMVGVTSVDAGTGTGTGTGTASGYPQSGTVVYWGDSMVLGLDANFNTGYIPPVTTFDDDLANFTASNEGVTDNTTTRTLNGTDTAHTALDTWLASHPCTYFICSLGYNDNYIDGGITPDQTRINLEAIIDKIRAAGAIAILETFNETDHEAGVSPHRDAIHTAATNKNVPIIDQYQYLYDYRIANNLGVYDMYPNGYHPTQAVYTMKGHYAATRFKQIIGAA